MKKALAAILALLYLSASSGAMIDIHYCMGRPAGWSLTLSESSSDCPNCGMSKKSGHGCCQDQYKILQVAKDHKAAEASFHFSPITALPVTTARAYEITPPPSANQAVLPFTHAPPPKGLVPAFIRHCSFLI